MDKWEWVWRLWINSPWSKYISKRRVNHIPTLVSGSEDQHMVCFGNESFNFKRCSSSVRLSARQHAHKENVNILMISRNNNVHYIHLSLQPMPISSTINTGTADANGIAISVLYVMKQRIWRLIIFDLMMALQEGSGDQQTSSTQTWLSNFMAIYQIDVEKCGFKPDTWSSSRCYWVIKVL